jgi:hypothetical protein
MKRGLDAIIVASAAVLLLVAGFGGFDFEFGALTVRARDWIRPAVLLVAAIAGRVAAERSSAVARSLAERGLLALILAAGLAYSQFHVPVAGGLDSYGYVSAARMIASGRLHEPQPLAAVLPFADGLKAATPLGHVPASDGHSSVPRFPLGLPLVMALFAKFHPEAPYFVPLVMGYAAIVLVYLIVREATDRTTGLFAAALVAVDPVFAVSAVYPMSDVPAACWLLAAIWTSRSHRVDALPWSVASGICAGMAVLTRPVLLPAVAVFVLINLRNGPRRCVVGRTAVTAAFLLIQMLLNISLYGSATMSGYGSASHMFELTPGRFGAAAANFGKWILYSRTVPVWLVWPAALVLFRRERWAWELSAIAVAAAAPYQFYLVFDNWASLRFLLPAMVLFLVLSARALGHVSSRSWRPVPLFLIALSCAVAARQFVIREDVGRGRTDEEKYPLVGAWFREHTSDRAVVLSSLHSGAIRLYSGRQTLRWDEIPENALDATIQKLAGLGYEPYLALDMPSEPPLFEQRFKSRKVIAEPLARVRVVVIYKFLSVE